MVSDIEVNLSSEKKDSQDANPIEQDKDVVDLDIKLDEPQILIGQQGKRFLKFSGF